MKENSSKYKYIDFLKCFVIFIIVLNHSIQYRWNAYKIISNDFQNPVLIFSSGLIFSYCINKLKKYKTIKDLSKKKSKRLLVPMFLTAILYYLPLMKLVNIWIKIKPYNINVLKIIPGYILGLNIDHLWFIYSLFLMYIILYFIIKKTKLLGNVFGQLLILLITFILNIGSYAISLPYFCIDKIMRYIIFFVTGYIFYLYDEKIYKDNEKSKRIIGLIVSLIIVVIIYYIDYKISFISGSHFTGSKIIAILGASLEIVKQFGMIYIICNVIKFIYEKFSFSKKRLTNFLIRNSFGIYLFHQPVVKILILVTAKVLPTSNNFKNFIYSLFTALIAIVISIIISRLVDLVKSKNKSTFPIKKVY